MNRGIKRLLMVFLIVLTGFIVINVVYYNSCRNNRLESIKSSEVFQANSLHSEIPENNFKSDSIKQGK